MSTETYTETELLAMIETAKDHARRADRHGLRDLARVARRQRREFEARLAEIRG